MNKEHLPDLTVPAKDVAPNSNLSTIFARTTGKAFRVRALVTQQDPTCEYLLLQLFQIMQVCLCICVLFI